MNHLQLRIGRIEPGDVIQAACHGIHEYGTTIREHARLVRAVVRREPDRLQQREVGQSVHLHLIAAMIVRGRAVQRIPAWKRHVRERYDDAVQGRDDGKAVRSQGFLVRSRIGGGSRAYDSSPLI